MPSIPLPENPSLEHLKSQAKLVRDLARSGDDGARQLVAEFHPALGSSAQAGDPLSRFRLTDAQLVVARLYGFASWIKLRDQLRLIGAFAWADPDDVPQGLDAANRFIVYACGSYSAANPRDRIEEARRLLAAEPGLGSASMAGLATVGDRRALADRLDEEPDRLDAPCGPNGWPLLLYCTYSRIETGQPDRSTLETARLLLDRGADPNAGFLWRGLVPPFTALTGALGRGEQDQPPHPHGLALARLLLEAGADPNDGQALYNNGLAGSANDDPAHLQLLVEFGLGIDQGGPWYRRFGTRLTPPGELLHDELEVAAIRNLPRRMRFLVGLGLDLDRPVGRSQQLPVRLAAGAGNDAVLAVLAEAGMDVTMTPAERFVLLARTATPAELRQHTERHPGLLAETIDRSPGLIKDIAAGERLPIVAELQRLGFDINARSSGAGITALHSAALANDVELARALVGMGADPDVVDPNYGASPLGWAEH
ncbi:MAG: ankyrin repeat domain-containing protein, partial [Acidimicrobiia bacterium]|nr:ankyrin repeat domain-containing protein [Acidimicrobiia bacterium]